MVAWRLERASCYTVVPWIEVEDDGIARSGSGYAGVKSQTTPTDSNVMLCSGGAGNQQSGGEETVLNAHCECGEKREFFFGKG